MNRRTNQSVGVEAIWRFPVFDSEILTNKISFMSAESYTTSWNSDVHNSSNIIASKTLQEAEIAHKKYVRIIEFMMDLPLSDMPLYINSEVDLVKYIACKRLES